MRTNAAKLLSSAIALSRQRLQKTLLISTAMTAAAATDKSITESSTHRPDEYVPPKVWTVDGENGGEWSKINRPTAGSRFDKELPVGKHPLQLYSMATPNGVKVTLMLEELFEAGVQDAEYDAWPISISKGDQFGSEFVEINPNSKIPALVDRSGDKTLRLFESGSILLHLAEKFGKFLPKDVTGRTEALNWLFWQMGSGPFVGGGFGHFFAYAPYKMKYPIDRFTMEVKRQLDVLDQHLAENDYMAGDEYSIADMAIWPWYGALVLGRLYDGSAEFLDVASYKNVMAWAKKIDERPAAIRGRKVNRTWGPLSEQLHERHDASDFELKTQDKIEQHERDDTNKKPRTQ